MRCPASVVVLVLTGTLLAATSLEASDVVSRIVIDVPETVARTQPFEGLVRATNDNLQTVPSYRGTVHFRATDGIVLPADYAFTDADQGSHTFTFMADRGGFAVITAEDVAQPTTGSSDSFYVDCPELTASASNTGPVCSNGTGTTGLTGSSNQDGVSYYWSGPHGWFSFLQNPSATQPGTYFLTVTNAEGCSANASTTVEPKQVPSPSVVLSAHAVCAGVPVTATVTDAANFSRFDWSLDGPATIASGQGTPSIQIATPSPETTIGIVVLVTALHNASGCPGSTNEAVTVDHHPIANVTTASSACPNTALTATTPVQPNATYEWSISNGTITRILGPALEFLTGDSGDTAVSVRVATSAASCDATSTAVISIDTAPAIVRDLRDVTVSRGTTATLSVEVNGQNLFYFWFRGAAGDRTHPAGSGPLPSFTTPPVTQPENYWVEIQGPCGTIASRTARVSIETKRRATRH